VATLTHIKHLRFDECRKIVNISPLATLEKLTGVSLKGTSAESLDALRSSEGMLGVIHVGNCSKLNNFTSLSSMRKL
jgi:hypothetical protein